MRKNRLAAAGLIALLFVASAFGQAPYRDQPQQTTRESITQPVIQNGISGLLDPSRISMNQQFGMSYMSSGGRGFTQGYYLNTLSYRFSAPVMLKLHLGATNNPFAQSTELPGQSAISSLLSNAEFFGGADLIWKPRDDMRLQLSFYQYPSTYSNPYGYGYGNRPGYGYAGISPWRYSNPAMINFDDIQP
ncbi:MAG: hypothetical protein V2A56_00680 [bacterium]